MSGNTHFLQTDEVFADYTILNFCGSGAYGEVYLAEDITHKVVALKLIPISYGSEVWRMELIGLRHYRQAVEDHKSLIEVLHVGETDNFFYYTMEAADNMLHGDSEEYVADTLAHRLERGGRLEPEKVLELAHNLLDALEHLSEHDLAHRDIKPANIVFINGQPKLSDIGLISNTGVRSKVVGTLEYLPPEIADGDPVGYGHDLYSLGKVLYCALTGLLPENFPEVPISVPLRAWRQFKNVLLKACSPDPRQRFYSPTSFRAALPSVIRETTFVDEAMEDLRSYRKMHPVAWRLSWFSVTLAIAAMTLSLFLAMNQKRAYHNARQDKISFIFRTIELLNDRQIHLQKLAGQSGNSARAWQLQTIAELASDARAEGDWDATERYCRLADAILKRWSVEEFRSLQETYPADKLPDDRNKLFEMLTAYTTFRATPLTAYQLDYAAQLLNETIAKLSEKAAAKWAGPLPGSNWQHPEIPDLKLVYMPQSSSEDGKPIRDFWVADTEVTNELFAQILPKSNLKLSSPQLPVTNLTWNDRLDFCRQLTLHARERGFLPDNYIFRLPYLDEWSYILRGGWSSAANFLYENRIIHKVAWFGGNSDYQLHPVRQLDSGELGIYDLLGNAAESVVAQPVEAGKRPVVYNMGASFRDRRLSQELQKKLDLDMLENKWSGFRVVLAPGTMEYFERCWFTGQAFTFRQAGDIYELLGTPYCRWTYRSAEAWKKLLETDPVMLQNNKLRNKLLQSNWRLHELPVLTSARYRNGQWLWSNGQKVRSGEWLSDIHGANASNNSMVWDHGFWRKTLQHETVPLILLKYPENRRHKLDLANKKSDLILKSFSLNSRKFYLLQAPVDWYTARRLCALLGGELAVFASQAELNSLKNSMKKFRNMRIALNCYRKNGKWEWANGAAGPKTLPPAKLHETVSLNRSFMALYNDEYCSSPEFDAFICEIK
ncbi:MAG: SUMF1/EgtB/PvdO family nonheme iron enzyme [Lentisphaeria bacterium]|nr:SUMF1/EgtB/PvdO family nonheme iron enzyme [Lentisphaeria bacterium]